VRGAPGDEGTYTLLDDCPVWANHWGCEAVSSGYSIETIGRMTVLNCPRCKNVLYEVPEGSSVRFLCRQEHGYTLDDVCGGVKSNFRSLLANVIDAVQKL
jgi:rRNA maturation protein Nop10